MLLAFVIWGANAHVHQVKGKVLNTNGDAAIPFLNISLKGTTIGAVSNEDGYFTLRDVPHGSYTLIVSGVGFKTVEVPLNLTGEHSRPLEIKTTEQSVAMDEVVVSANRNERKKQEASTIVGIISPKMFEITNANNLSQGLNFQAGLRVENSCQNCGFPQVRINGLDGQYSQILIDSRPIFSSLSGVYGLEQLPANMVERVEVIRGGGSSLFGSNAVGGVVNIITKEPLANSFSIGNNTSLIGMKAADINTSLNASLVTDDFKSGIYLFGMVRDRHQYDRDGDGFSELGKLNSTTIGFRGYHKTSAFSKLTVEYHHLDEFRRGGNKLDLPAHEADIAEQTQYYTNGGSIKFDLFGKDYHKHLNIYTAFQHNNRSSYYGAGQDPNAYGRTKDITAVAGVQYSHKFDKLLFMPSELTLGAEHSFNQLEDDAPGYDRYLNQKTNVSSVFVQNEWSTTKYGILVGARLDKHNLVSNPIVSPRVNLRYNPSKLVNFRATYSSGFRAPQAYDEDLHILAVSGEVALITIDPNLKAERSHSVSGSVDLYPTWGSVQTNFLVEGFYTKLNDKFEIVESGSDANGNILRTRINGPGAYVAGVNLEGKAFFSEHFDLQAGYTLQQSRYDEPWDWSGDPSLTPQKRMFRTPTTYGFITANYEITKGLLASLTGTHTGPMLVQHVKSSFAPGSTTDVVTENLEKLTPNFFDLGLRVAYDFKLNKSLKLQLNGGIQNIFDSYQNDLDQGELRDAKYIYGPSLPRSVTFGAKLFL